MRIQIRNILPSRPAFCSPGTPLGEIIHRLIENDCAALTVVSDGGNRSPIGLVTSADVLHAGIVRDGSSRSLTAQEVMRPPRVIIREELSLEDGARVLREYGSSVAPVVDEWGQFRGAVTDAQLEEAQRRSNREQASIGAAPRGEGFSLCPRPPRG